MIEEVTIPDLENPNSDAVRLLKYVLREKISNIEPLIVPISKTGYKYDKAEKELNLTTHETVLLFDSLTKAGIFKKSAFASYLTCPECQSPNLRSAIGCPECGSDTIDRGRILEHFFCGHVGLESEYMEDGKYVCPKCKKEVKFLGTDYMSVGVKYRCKKCSQIFMEPASMQICLKCQNFFFTSEAKENTAYSYMLAKEQKLRLEFDFGLKKKLVNFLRTRAYVITENDTVSGKSKSGEYHTFDLLARRYDGLLNYTVCIDTIIDPDNNEIGLDEVFKFDSKAYDLGLHDKILIAVPGVSEKAAKFARQQRITLYQGSELASVIDSLHLRPQPSLKMEPVKFNNLQDVTDFLQSAGYDIDQKVKIKGRSGIEHLIDIYGSMRDGIIFHTIDIGVLVGSEAIGIDPVFLFDSRAYDIQVHDKVVLVSPGLDSEAKSFADFQGIKVIEINRTGV
jgi:hypothetical protein